MLPGIASLQDMADEGAGGGEGGREGFHFKKQDFVMRLSKNTTQNTTLLLLHMGDAAGSCLS